MKIWVVFVAILAFFGVGDVDAACSVFPPSYEPDASATEVKEATLARESWEANGCASSLVVRQEYFQTLYESCVAALVAPVDAGEAAAGGYESQAYIEYMEKIRECQKKALVAGEAARFVGNPPTLVTAGSP